jgi:hypothetical protein
MNFSDWAVVASAIATAASAAVVGVQAFHTSASAKASKEAVDVAQETLREAQRTRLDSRSPQIVVSLVSSMHPVRGREDFEGKLLDVEQKDLTTYRTPRDLEKVLTARLEFIVRNDGHTPVSLKSSKQLWEPNGHSILSLVVPPGGSVSATFNVSKALSEWIQLYEAGVNKAQAAKPLAGSLKLTYSGPGDSDVDALYVVEAHGSILEPISGEGDGWRLQMDWTRELHGVTLPTKFTYIKSRTTGEKL